MLVASLHHRSLHLCRNRDARTLLLLPARSQLDSSLVLVVCFVICLILADSCPSRRPPPRQSPPPHKSPLSVETGTLVLVIIDFVTVGFTLDQDDPSYLRHHVKHHRNCNSGNPSMAQEKHGRQSRRSSIRQMAKEFT